MIYQPQRPRFWRIYLSHWLRYPWFFFRNAPVSRWLDFFGSTHRVALGLARMQCAIADEQNMWIRHALRYRFIRNMESQRNELP